MDHILHPPGLRGRQRPPRGLTLIEGLVASVILSLVAAGAAMAVGVGVGAQRDANLQLLAGVAAEQQASTLLACPYLSTPTFAGTEAVGAMLTPPRPNGSGGEVRDSMGPAFAAFGRTTTVTAQTRTFAQYNNFALEGWKIVIVISDAAGRQIVSIERFRPKELGS